MTPSFVTLPSEVYGHPVDDPSCALSWIPRLPQDTVKYPGKRPAVLIIHGGGFIGDPASPQTQACAGDLATNGFITFQIKYRLAPSSSQALVRPPGQTTTGRFPQQPTDVAMAVVAARSDPRCNGLVFGVGGSAGGTHVTYACGVGTVGVDRMDGCVSISGAYDFADRTPDYDGTLGYYSGFEGYIQNYCDPSSDENHRLTEADTARFTATSPVTLIDNKISPQRLYHTLNDAMPHPQQTRLIEKLNALAVTNFQAFDLGPITNSTHSFANWPVIKGDPTIPGDSGAITYLLGLANGVIIVPPPVPGCTDPLANNYNPLATVDDGSCTYGGGGGGGAVYGCTNPQALNYNPLATIDDGSCIFSGPPPPPPPPAGVLLPYTAILHGGPGIIPDIPGDSTSFDVTGLSPGTDYTLQLKANNAVGPSLPAIVAFTSDPAIPVVMQPPPVITSISPDIGPPGTTIVITGNGFTNATGVNIGFFPLDTFVIDSDSQISAVAKQGAVSGTVVIAFKDGSAITGPYFTVAVVPPPEISGFYPTSAPPGFSPVYVFGANLGGTTQLTLNGVPSNYAIAADDELDLTLSDTDTTGFLTVTTPGGTATSATQLIVVPINTGAPTVTSFSPTTGKQGDVITILGSGFTGATSVKINGVSMAGFFILSDSSISGTISYLNTTGTVSVTTPAGTGTSADTFTILPSYPVITGFTPTSGPPGTSVQIGGTGLYGATAVQLRNVDVASFSQLPGDDGAGLITAIIASGNMTGQFSVTTPVSTAYSGAGFTVTAPISVPVITSFAPASGRSGTIIVVTGKGFVGATDVQLGVDDLGTPGGAWTINSDTQITITTAFSNQGGLIKVTKSGGTATSKTAFTRLKSAPVITSFSPASGSSNFGRVTVYGLGLDSNVVLLTGGFKIAGSTVADYQPLGDGKSAIVTIDPTNVTGHFSATNPDGTGIAVGVFTVVQTTPVITSFAPISGRPGTTVTINGSRFTGADSVTIGAVKAQSYLVVSDTKITAVVATGTKTGQIFVETRTGGTGHSATNFTVTT